jgi:hypothetical protein
MVPMHPRALPFRSGRRRTVTAAAGAVVLLLSALAPVAAVEPIDTRDREPLPRAVREPMPPPPIVRPTPAPTPAPDPGPTGPIGHDVSWPQCNDPELPADFGYAIVGVNRGRVHSENPCLREQLEWAGPGADVYMNTANPGPDHSQFWPAGQARPRSCDTPARPGDDTWNCAWLYGWNAAADAYARALAAWIDLGWLEEDAERLPDGVTWWLDVETANSWRWNRSLNVASLHGSVDFLESMDAGEIGFYSTPLLWWRVTGGTDDFADYAAWHAGGRSRDEAERRCAEHEAFTGGELRMVQWIEGGLDTNLLCEAA